MESKENKRIMWIDEAKGLGIILVVLLHIPNVQNMSYFSLWGGYIQVFYMPLFFIISGIFVKPENLRNKFKRLMIPYLVYYAISFLLYILKGISKHTSIHLAYFLEPFRGATNNYENTPIWFLLCLFEIIVIYNIIIKLKFNLHVTLLILSILGFFLGKKFGAGPFYINTAFLCSIFILSSNFKEYILLNLHKHSWICLFVIMGYAIYLIQQKGCNVSQNQINCGYLSFLSISIFTFLGIGGILRWQNTNFKRILSFYGSNSLIVLCTHLNFMFIANVIIKYIRNFDIACIFSLLTILVLEIPIIIINRKFKFLK